MGQFTQDGIIYEEMPNGQVRVVGYADAPPPVSGGRVFTLPLSPEKAKEEARKDRDQQLQEENAIRAERAADRADKTAQRQAAAAERSAEAQNKPTEFQSKTAGFYGRMLQAERDFNAIPEDERGGRSIGRQFVHNAFPGTENTLLNSADRQKADQAVENFIAASLRQESGASISPAEFTRQYNIFFPSPGDSAEVIKQKAEARAQAIAGFRVAAGPLAEQMDKTSSIMPNALSSDQQSVATGDTKTETVRGPVEKQLSAMLQKGTPSANIRAFAKQNNFPAGKVERVLAWRAMNPQYKGPYNVSTEVITPTSPFNKFEASPLATIATQAANATSAGTLDEIGGAVNSLVTGDPLSESIAAGDMNKQMQAQLNPKSALAGNVVGGTAAMLGGGAWLANALRAGARGGAGRGLLAWAARNPIKAAAVGDAGYGAAYGAGEMNDNRLGGAATGLVVAPIASLAGSGATKAVGSAFRGVVDPAVDRLRAAGIPLTGAEVLGGGWKKAQDALTSLPVVGSMVARRAEEGRRALNEAAFNAAGSTIGQPINGVGQEGIDLLRNAKSRAYSNALDPVSLDLMDPVFGQDIQALGTEILKIPNTEARQVAFEALQGRIKNNLDPNTSNMTGRNFQEAYRGLGRERKEVRPYAHEIGQVARGGQDALAGALERQNPGAYQGFLKANSANRHLNILADAVTAAKSQLENGDELFTPLQLGTAATNNTKTYGGKLAAAMGDRPFNQLIKDATEVMGQKVPDSGTATRAAVGLGLTSLGTGGAGYGADGGSGATVGALAPAAVLTLLGTRRGQQALTAALLNRAAPFRRAGTAIRNNANIGGDVLTAAGIPLLYPPSP